MGSFQSKPNSIYTSKPSSIHSNLDWSLANCLKWESRANQTKRLLHFQSDTQVIENLKNHSITHMIHEQANVVHSLKELITKVIQTPYVSEELQREKYISDLTASQASTVFDTVAVETMQKQYHGAYDSSYNDRQYFRSDHRTDSKMNMSEKYPEEEPKAWPRRGSKDSGLQQKNFPGPSVGYTDYPRSEPISEDSSLNDLSAERKRLVAKYIFIHRCCRQLVKSAEYGLKLKIQIDEMSHGRWVDSSNGTQPAQMKKIHRKLFSQALANFDRAKITVKWLQYAYDLSILLFNVRRETKYATIARGIINAQYQVGQSHTAHMLPALTQIHNLLGQLTYQNVLVDSAILRHDRTAITLGQNYLERTEGGLTPTDVPDISARSWSAMDLKPQNKVTAQQLQVAIDSQATILKEIENKIFALEEQSKRIQPLPEYQIQLTRINLEIRQLKLEADQEKATISQFNSLFLQAFVKNVFHHLSLDFLSAAADPSSLDPQLLMAALENVEKSLNKDPISVSKEEEMEIAASEEVEKKKIIPGFKESKTESEMAHDDRKLYTPIGHQSDSRIGLSTGRIERDASSAAVNGHSPQMYQNISSRPVVVDSNTPGLSRTTNFPKQTQEEQQPPRQLQIDEHPDQPPATVLSSQQNGLTAIDRPGAAVVSQSVRVSQPGKDFLPGINSGPTSAGSALDATGPNQGDTARMQKGLPSGPDPQQGASQLPGSTADPASAIPVLIETLTGKEDVGKVQKAHEEQENHFTPIQPHPNDYGGLETRDVDYVTVASAENVNRKLETV